MSYKAQMHGGGESYRGSEPNGLDRVRQAAKKDKKLRFTALLHHVNPDLLRSSYFSLKRRAGTAGLRASPSATSVVGILTPSL